MSNSIRSTGREGTSRLLVGLLSLLSVTNGSRGVEKKKIQSASFRVYMH